jgi:RimJ/RimL family protein N-acetyltransferase
MPTTLLPLNDLDIESLERATLDAVAPPNMHELPHWLLPFDHSTIGRAKSAVPLRHHGLHEDVLQEIVGCYAAHGFPAAFRIADVPALANIQHRLRQLGFVPTQPTLVQISSMNGLMSLPCGAPARVSRLPTAPWAAVYSATGFDPVDGAHRVQALSRSACIAYAVVTDEGELRPLAAGTASISQGWAGIHGMRTVVQERGRGLAARILGGLARHAKTQGIERIFLQVEEENSAAIALYRRAGFTTAWRYHYWRYP